MKDLLLTIEVLRPTTARYDGYTKTRLYQDVGIPFYWVVDPDEKLVAVCTPESLFPRVECHPVECKRGSSARVRLDLAVLFKPI
jgi:Uma2 family endonuclease